jgi:hypothetical protein
MFAKSEVDRYCIANSSHSFISKEAYEKYQESNIVNQGK